MEKSIFAAEIMAIGDELLLGRIYDTNSFWLATQLSLLGFNVQRITCLPDHEPTIVEAFHGAKARQTRLLVTTGGLGPTPDDRTVDAIAEAIGSEVHSDPGTLEIYCQRRNLTLETMPPTMMKMASVPVAATVLGNPNGWAPALSADLDGMQIISMPGPPKEVQAIWEQLVRDNLADVTGRRGAHKRVRVDMYESEVSPLMQEVMTRFPGTYIKALIALGTPEAGLPIDVVCYANTVEGSVETLRSAIDALAELAEKKNKHVFFD